MFEDERSCRLWSPQRPSAAFVGVVFGVGDRSAGLTLRYFPGSLSRSMVRSGLLALLTEYCESLRSVPRHTTFARICLMLAPLLPCTLMSPWPSGPQISVPVESSLVPALRLRMCVATTRHISPRSESCGASDGVCGSLDSVQDSFDGSGSTPASTTASRVVGVGLLLFARMMLHYGAWLSGLCHMCC